MIADLAAAPGIAAMRRRIRRETRDPQNLYMTWCIILLLITL